MNPFDALLAVNFLRRAPPWPAGEIILRRGLVLRLAIVLVAVLAVMGALSMPQVATRLAAG